MELQGRCSSRSIAGCTLDTACARTLYTAIYGVVIGHSHAAMSRCGYKHVAGSKAHQGGTGNH